MTSHDRPGDLGGSTAGSRVGARVGKYLIEEQIGRGGMAAVFRARDVELGRVVALKILAPALAADEGFRQRFVRESRAAAAVDDPHIIPLYEAGQDGAALFIAMRYVSGGDVRSLLFRQGSLTPEQVAGIVSAVASALDAAHANGLVHRDVKPANMLLDSAPGRPDHVYLSDFGLSKEAAGSIGLTGTGLFLGTVDYAAPEQIDGRAVDGRTDQYSLGCAAFEMFSGVPPFRRDHGMAVLAAHLSQAPPRLSELRPSLPPGLDTVFAKVLAKSPDGRYRTCGEFGEALREVCGFGRYDAGPAGPGAGQGAGRQQTELAWNAYGPASGGDALIAGAGQAGAGAVGAGAVGGGAVGGGAVGGGHIIPGFGSQPSSPVPHYPPPPAWVNTGPVQRPGPSRWPIAIASTAIAAAIVVAAIILVTRANSSSSDANSPAGTPTVTVTSSGTPSPTTGSSGVSPQVVTTLPVTNSPAVSVPASTVPVSSPVGNSEPAFTRYEYPGEFSMKLPTGWAQMANTFPGDRVTFGNSAGFQVIIDWTPWHRSPVAHQRMLSRRTLSAHGSAYNELSIQSVPYHGFDTADWQFTDYLNGVQIESIDRAFIVSSGSTYAVELYGPIGQFQSVYDSVWSKMLQSFQPES